MTGTERIVAERVRQIEEEGWTADHDRQHNPEDLVQAAKCYVRDVLAPVDRTDPNTNECPADWPWDAYWWKPTPEDPGRQLEKAGALIAAAIDRYSQQAV